MGDFVVGADFIEAIWDLLIDQGRVFEHNSDRLDQFVEDGWVSTSDIDDLLHERCPGVAFRLCGKQLVDVFNIPTRTAYRKPSPKSRNANGFEMLAVADLAQILIWLERFGLDVDPLPIVQRLLPKLASMGKLTASELSVWWYADQRHKDIPVSLRTDPAMRSRPTKSESLRTSDGYKAELLSTDQRPCQLDVRAPKFRRRDPPVQTKCSICGDVFYRGDPESSAAHRTEHRKRLMYLDPQPHPKFSIERAAGDDAELVTAASPRWKHDEMFRRARAFRREFGYDFVQWDSPVDTDPNMAGYLFGDKEGRIVGACAFRFREYADETAPRWGLQWVWVCPKYRRQGVLAARWAYFKERFGDFHIEGPVSKAMEAFAVKKGDVRLLGYDPTEDDDSPTDPDMIV